MDVRSKHDENLGRSKMKTGNPEMQDIAR